MIGLLILGVVIIVLSTTGQQDLSSNRYIVDTNPRNTGSGIPVYMKTDWGDEEHLRNFPLQIGDWYGSEYDKSPLEQTLEADVVLMRTYVKTNPFQPVFLTLVQSSSQGSFIFHLPSRCYSDQGWQVESEVQDALPITDASWWKRYGDQDNQWANWVWIKRMVVFKASQGRISDRRVVLYFYVKGANLASDKTDMVEVSTPAPPEGNYDKALATAKELMSDVFPLLFEPGEKSEMLITRLSESGIGGYLIISVLFLIPLALFVIPVFVRLKRKSV